MKQLISAIVLNYTTPKLTVRCVRALLRQTVADRLRISIVDNHSGDDSIQYIRNAFRNEPSVHIFESRENIGFGRGNDLAIRHAESEYILIINPDNELQPDGLEKLIAVMEQDSSIGIVGPKLLHDDGTVRLSARFFPNIPDPFVKRIFPVFFSKRVDRYLEKTGGRDSIRDVDWLVGACLLIRHDLYDKLGGFDPRFFLFFEDTDFCRRAKLAGKRVVFVPTVTATDRKRRLSDGRFLRLILKKTMWIHFFSWMKYFWKWRTQNPPRT